MSSCRVSVAQLTVGNMAMAGAVTVIVTMVVTVTARGAWGPTV